MNCRQRKRQRLPLAAAVFSPKRLGTRCARTLPVDREWNRMETSLFDPLAGGFLGLDLLHSILVRKVDTALRQCR